MSYLKNLAASHYKITNQARQTSTFTSKYIIKKFSKKKNIFCNIKNMELENVSPPVAEAQLEIEEEMADIKPDLRKELINLVMWRDWRKTLVTLAILQAIIFDLTYKSLISVLCIPALTFIFITIGYRVYVQIRQWMAHSQKSANPYQSYLDMDISISEEMAQQIALLLATKTNSFQKKLQSVMLGEKPLETAKWIGILALASFVGEIFNTTTVMQLGLIVLFSLPKLYEWKEPISDFLALACQKLLKWASTFNDTELETKPRCIMTKEDIQKARFIIQQTIDLLQEAEKSQPNFNTEVKKIEINAEASEKLDESGDPNDYPVVVKNE